MDIRLTIDATPSLLDVLQKLAEGLRGLSTPAQTLPQQAPVSQAPETIVPKTPPAAQAAVPTSAPAYSLDDIMRAAVALSDSGKRDAVLALMSSFGAAVLTQLPPERYGEFATALRGLGANI